MQVLMTYIMLESTVKFLRCVRCSSKLELDVFDLDREINEGMLKCLNCNLTFPIIQKIPIMWDDFSKYLFHRRYLSGYLYRNAKDKKIKEYVKSILSENSFSENDRSIIEERWTRIYQNSKNSKFYSAIKKHLESVVPKTKFILEYGCSIGLLTSHLSNSHDVVFGIDRSFHAIMIAKKSLKQNLDYVVADSLSPVFGKLKFDMVIGLNILEFIEPDKLLHHISNQITSGHIVISDPYDFDRGLNSVRTFVDESTLRSMISKFNFKIIQNTKNPSFIPWNLKINSRAELNYKVDLVIAKK